MASKWREHPATTQFSTEKLSLGERAADVIRNGMGSWGFVFGSIIFLAAWIYINQGSGFDPFPFILLNLLLSCVAALQGAILLIAARREDQINSALAVHTYQIDQENLELTRQVHELSVHIEALTKEVHAAVRNPNQD